MELKEIARRALVECMALQNNETALVVTDGTVPEVAGAFWQAARELTREAIWMEFQPRSRHGEEPPAAVAASMTAADVLLLPTSRSLSHTRARRKACETGARVASMPMITTEMMARALAVDYEAMRSLTRKYVEVLTASGVARVTSPGGTDITMELKGRIGFMDAGELQQRGASGNLPAGEAYIAPLEGSAEGVVVLDGSLAGWGRLEEPIIIEVKEGLAVRVEGGEAARWLWESLTKCGEAGTALAELGIGTNEKAIVSGNILEDEKAIGTVHIAFGDNKGFGGKVEAGIHLDGLILKPTVEVDGEVVIKEGRLLLR
ncbi:aminopeptidase [Moorella stamsii]|uniref:aminopeptidase n=1 Tax=Neomoorella stamsii TaxID=1266720 RepID=UPI001FCBF11B|nr:MULTISPECIES: aminopeptidase [Moorella]